VARFLPPKREKPLMENVTVRLRPAVKKAARALAHERGMSLSEFCAAVIDNVVREAGGEQAA
jgi:predicted HicB family RNase H-like nuclease